jgi:hypothetical protein
MTNENTDKGHKIFVFKKIIEINFTDILFEGEIVNLLQKNIWIAD